MAAVSDLTLEKIIGEAIRRMLTVEHSAAGIVLSLPVTYPSGAAVAVEIKGEPSRCTVTDLAMGYEEAELIGAEAEFVRRARSASVEAGIDFDGHLFSIRDVNPERLPGAVSTVASCALQSVYAAAARASEGGYD